MKIKPVFVVQAGLTLALYCSSGIALANNVNLKDSSLNIETNNTPSIPLNPDNVPDFAPMKRVNPNNATNQASSADTPLKADAASSSLPVSTRLKLILETIVNARKSNPGDIFEAHVKDDLYLGRYLILPRGSLVRGRIVDVTKPKLLSRAARIGLKLEQIDTPTGEIIPLDATLEFRKGLTNSQGQFDPGTNFGTVVGSNLKSVTGGNSTGAAKNALIAANIATLGAPAVATLIGSSAYALFRSGDNVTLNPGQEIEITLTNALSLQVN